MTDHRPPPATAPDSVWGTPFAIVACTAEHTSEDGCASCGWDGDHATSVQTAPASGRRAACSCGWRGTWRHGPSDAWLAGADADDHYNDQE